MALCLGIAASPAVAQDNTGTISGTVVDSQGQVVPGANVSLIRESTKYLRPTTTNAKGEFRYVGVQPGEYTVRVELAGFSAYEIKNQNFATSMSLDLGKITLKVGGLTDVVTVVASGTPIEVKNSDPSSLLTSTQIEQISTIGRDVSSLLRLLPGVAYQGDAESLGGTGFTSSMPTIGGARKDFNHVTVDGVFANEIGGGGNMTMVINLDSVAEIKVLNSTYRAEFGRGGAQVQVTGKQGGADYHGSAGYYKRDKALNANDWDRNREKIERAPYSFDTFVASLGGPLPLANRDKLFFFYSGERALTTNPQDVREWRVPTALERQGDFSQTFRAPSIKRDSRGNIASCTPGSLIVVTDPVTKQPFPGNKIPTDRFNPNGQALLNVFPAPNWTDPQGCYAENYRLTDLARDVNKWNHQIRFDYKASPTRSFYLSYRNNISEQIGDGSSAGPSTAGRWGLYENHYRGDSNTATVGWSQSISRSVFNELLVSFRRDSEATFTNDKDLLRMKRASVGYTLPTVFPGINPDDLLPNASFNSSNIPARGNDQRAAINISNRFPLDGHNYSLNLRQNIQWIKATHLFKSGLYLEYLYDSEGSRGGANVGSFSFEDNANNPNRTGYGYANALLGVFHNYTESSNRRKNDGHGSVAEWYLQDTWNVSRTFTLDYGIRFQWIAQPWKKGITDYSVFVPDRWDPAQKPLLYQPYRSGTKVPPDVTGALNPLTGQILGARFANTYIPDFGNINNGMVNYGDPTYYEGFQKRQPPLPEPAIGFAWEVGGTGKTVVRGGARITHQPQLGVGQVTNLLGNPPFGRQINTDFGTFDTLATTQRFYSPGDVRGQDPLLETPSLYAFSLGMEQSIGFGTVIGATYSGQLGRHLNQSRNLNTVPPGARWNPKNLDNAGQALPDNHLRPYYGMAAVNWLSNFGTSNYHSLQTSLVRRYSKGFQFSVAYTWSRTLGISDGDGGGIVLYRPIHEWNYAPTEKSQTHNFELSYTWDVPKASRLWDNGVVRFLFDNWQISGENALVSGDWQDIDFDRTFTIETLNADGTISSTSTDIDYSGGAHDYRPIMTGNPNAKRGDGVNTPVFDISVFQKPKEPVPGQAITWENYGNTPRRIIRRGGVNNWNLSFFKNFRLGGGRRLQFRWEIYNVLNHTQFDDFNNDVEFKQTPDGQIVQRNGDLGYYTSARNPRRMQGALKLTF